MIIRISLGFFEPERATEIANLLNDKDEILRNAIGKLRGNLAYYVTVDAKVGAMSNVSHWETQEEAMQMSTLPEMLALRSDFEALNVKFVPITNHEILWVLPA